MKVDYGFILAAGFGTRMGEIGKILPKLLWPIFNKRLVELQYEFLKDLGAQKIFINSHFLHKKLESFIQSKLPDLNILYEDEVLDVGGGILNFAREVGFKGNALVVNGDQFLIFDKKIIKDSLINLDSVTLFGTKENSNDGYNRLDIKNDLLVGITKNSEIPRNENLITYSGMSLFDLSKIDNLQGNKFKFFESVADYKKNKIVVKTLEDYEYWDFGTVRRFIESYFDLRDKQSKFYSFLESKKCISDINVFKEKVVLDVDSNQFVIEKNKISYGNIISNP